MATMRNIKDMLDRVALAKQYFKGISETMESTDVDKAILDDKVIIVTHVYISGVYTSCLCSMDMGKYHMLGNLTLKQGSHQTE
jgi:hypothetical protein